MSENKPGAYYVDGIEQRSDIGVSITQDDIPWYLTLDIGTIHHEGIIDLDIERAEEFAKAILTRVEWIKYNQHDALNNNNEEIK